MNSVEALAVVGDLLEATIGGYVSKAKVAALLAAERDEHDGHGYLTVWNQGICSCGQWSPGVTSIVIPEETPLFNAHMAAVEAFAKVLETDDRYNLNACITAAVDAALRAYGV